MELKNKTNSFRSEQKAAPKRDERTASTMTKEERQQKAEESRALRARSEKIKKKVFEFEKRNRSKLILFVSTGGFWKMGGNSALFFYHVIAPRIKADAKIKPDRDFYSNFPHGVISFKDIDGLERKLKIIDVKLKTRSEDVIIFELNETFSDEEIERLEKIEKVKREKINTILDVKNSKAGLFVELKNFHESVFIIVRKMESGVREIIGKEFYEQVLGIFENYFFATKDDLWSEYMLKIYQNLPEIKIKLKIMQELNLIDVDKCLALAQRLGNIEKLVLEELK